MNAAYALRSVLLTLLLGLSVALPTQAAIDAYEFKDEATEERFQQLTAELRCPKCQNQNIADSDAPIAQDLRAEVYRMVQAGESDQQIVDFMVTRYGEFVLYRPKVNEQTWLLWYGPFGLLAIGVLVVLFLSRRRKRRGAPGTDAPAADGGLNSGERERLDQLLQQDRDR